MDWRREAFKILAMGAWLCSICHMSQFLSSEHLINPRSASQPGLHIRTVPEFNQQQQNDLASSIHSEESRISQSSTPDIVFRAPKRFECTALVRITNPRDNFIVQ